jgi:hypothetical protein
VTVARAFGAVVTLAAFVACGKNTDDHPAPPAAVQPSHLTQAREWPTQALETVSGDLDGDEWGHHAFTVTIPAGLARHAIGHIGVSFGGMPDFSAPRVDIGYDTQVKTLDEFVAQATQIAKVQPGDIVRREQLAQGTFVVIHGHTENELWAVRLQHPIDDRRAVTCYAQHREAGKGALTDASRAMLEHICLSLTVR